MPGSHRRAKTCYAAPTSEETVNLSTATHRLRINADDDMTDMLMSLVHLSYDKPRLALGDRCFSSVLDLKPGWILSRQKHVRGEDEVRDYKKGRRQP